MASYVKQLRRRGDVAASFEVTTPAGAQEDDEIDYDHSILEAFKDKAGITDDDIKREHSSDDGSWTEIDVLTTTLSVQRAYAAGAKRAWVIYHPSDASAGLTRVRLSKTWFLSRNFGRPFQVVVAGSALVGLGAFVYIASRLFGYDNAGDIVWSTLKDGFGF